MPAWLLPLADGDDALIKFAVTIGALVIWGIAALIKAANKRPKATPPRPPVAFNQAAPPPLPARRRASAPARAAQLPPLPATTRTVTRQQAIDPSPQAPDAPGQRQRATASKAARLLAPKTLRAQFILAEALQPPLALRNNRKF